MQKRGILFYSVFGPLFFLHFFLATKTTTTNNSNKQKKLGVVALGYAAKVSPHTYARWFVRQTAWCPDFSPLLFSKKVSKLFSIPCLVVYALVIYLSDFLYNLPCPVSNLLFLLLLLHVVL